MSIKPLSEEPSDQWVHAGGVRHLDVIFALASRWSGRGRPATLATIDKEKDRGWSVRHAEKIPKHRHTRGAWTYLRPMGTLGLRLQPRAVPSIQWLTTKTTNPKIGPRENSKQPSCQDITTRSESGAPGCYQERGAHRYGVHDPGTGSEPPHTRKYYDSLLLATRGMLSLF